MILASYSGSLTDEHILELSKGITEEEELMVLGIKVLNLPKYVIKKAMYQKEIQPATHEVLSRWVNKENNRQEAYINLYEGLRKAEMNHLAAELKQWVEGTAAEMSRALQDGESTGVIHLEN